MEISLSDRLFRIASYVEQGSIPVDVGTDHAHLPIYLLQTGVSPRAFATELRPGPFKNAEFYAKKYGVADRLTLYLCDGLALCDPECLDTVIMAGMGGETMMHIMENAPWALSKHLILQPQTKIPELRRYLASSGLTILDASLASDAGKLYLIWLVGPGAMNADVLVDSQLIQKKDPLVKPYLRELIRRHEKQMRGLEGSQEPDIVALERLNRQFSALQELYDSV